MLRPYNEEEVAHLRRSEFKLLHFPALTHWANLCHAYGAGRKAPA
jgi:hypothetical protein